jgi:hypothetical protein
MKNNIYGYTWISTNKMTVLAVSQGGYLVDGPPIIRKFIGQPMDNLMKWMKKQDGFKWCYWE